MKSVSVLQSNYIPWKGYFDIINDVDLFVFYDDVQYTKNDWRNRNKIKTINGSVWLTVPVGTSLDRFVYDVEIKGDRWAIKHWKTISQNYSKAPFFNQYKAFFEEIYLGTSWRNLSTLNQFIIKKIATELLGIQTEFKNSQEYGAQGKKQDRLLDLLHQVGAEKYLSGPAARDYIDESTFQDAGIELIYKDYSGYPEHPQFHPPFEHGVSILDLIFHVGPEAPYYVWGWRDRN